MATGCALNTDGKLKSTSDIEFFFDSETDSCPIRSCTAHAEPKKKDRTGLCFNYAFFSHIYDDFSGQCARQDAKDAKMAQYLAEEHSNSEGTPNKKTHVTFKRCPHKKKVKHNTVIQGDNNDSSNDSDFVSGSSESDSSDDNYGDDKLLTNAEVSGAYIL